MILLVTMSKLSETVKLFPKITLRLILNPREKRLLDVVGQTKKRGKTRWMGMLAPLITSPSAICRLITWKNVKTQLR